MEIGPEDLTNETDIREVVRRLKTDFGEDVFCMLPIYEQVDKNQQEFLLNDLKGHYKN